MPVKTYKINGENIELFKIGELASSVGKSVETIRKWELTGLIPKAGFRDKSSRRLYLKEEIDSLVKIVIEEKPYRGRSMASTKMKSRTYNEWGKIRKSMLGGKYNAKKDEKEVG